MTNLPYGLEIVESCMSCKLRSGKLFCALPDQLLQAFEELKYSTTFPKGAMLFMEGQSARGVFILCSGQVKLSTCSSDGKAMITQIAEPGEVLGLSATVSDKPYEVTAETLAPCQVNFVRREDFLKFLAAHGEACLRVAQQLSNNYHSAYEQARSLGLSGSVGEKLAKFVLDLSERHGKPCDRGIQLKLTLTHEEIAQLIGTSRETVTRLLGEFKREGLIQVKGATLVVREKSRLEALVKA